MIRANATTAKQETRIRGRFFQDNRLNDNTSKMGHSSEPGLSAQDNEFVPLQNR